MKMRSFEVMQEEKHLPEWQIKLATMVPAVKDWAYVLHDKDTDEAGNPKRPHWHVICRLKYPSDSKHIARWFETPEHFVNKIKGKWSDVCKYLLHENAPTKHQYSVEDVKTNFDFITEKDKKFNSRLGEIINGISSGVIRDFNISKHVTDGEYVKYSMAIKRAFEYRRKMILEGGKNMQVIFIAGPSGVGKTTYAKSIADSLKYSYFVAGSTRDPFQGYGGQDCVILDDLRPDEHHISDLLKMMDNHTSSLVSSRYFDKSITEVKLMIITSVHTVEQFYKQALFSEPDLAVQLCRRVFGYFMMESDVIKICAYNFKLGRYEEIGQEPNVVKQVYNDTEESMKQKIDDLRNIVSGAGKCLLKISEDVEDYIEPEEPVSQQPPQRARGERCKPKKTPKRK